MRSPSSLHVLAVHTLILVAAAPWVGCASAPPSPDTSRRYPPPGAPARDLPAASASATASESRDPLAAPPDVAGPPADAAFTPSGLASRVIKAGTGTRHPSARDTVVVHYTGWTTDGVRFDSSVARGEPAVFPLNRVIRGWTEGLQLMVEGERRRLWIPAELAYGAHPRPGAPAGMLVFDVELLGIQ